MTRSFIHQSNDRQLPADYAGDILLWDIDKTYLDTRFSSVRGLLAIPFQFAIDKESIPGSVPLIRALRRGAGETSAIVPLYFISGSPPQLRPVIERKMTLDGVEFDGITFKDQLGLLLSGRPRAIKAQVGYKLQSLLLYRRELPSAARWLLFGDDTEDDAAAFLLFGEVCAGLRNDPLRERLRALKVVESDIDAIWQLANSIEPADNPVERVFIHLERRTDPERFNDSRVVPTWSYLQTAMVLASLKKVPPGAIAAVAKDLRRRLVPEDEIRRHIDDAEHRLEVSHDLAELARL